jgi:hypothetical protein
MTFSVRRHDIIAIALLVMIAAALLVDVVAGSNVFYFRDLTRYYFPVKKMMRDIVLGGEFPWWTRAYSAGQPIAANPEHEVFYPPTWLILLPNYRFGFHLEILVHLAVALIGMYAFLRSIELVPFTAFFGALSFGLGGVALSYINLLPYLYCAAWLPLTCLYTRKFLLHRTARAFALAAVCLGLQLLVGEPTTIIQSLLILGAYALYRGWQSPEAPTKPLRARLAPLASVVGVAAVALFLAAAQILPAIDHVRDSARSRPFGFETVSAWSMPWVKLLELAFPNILGHLMIDRVSWYWGASMYGAAHSPFVVNIYPGLLVTVLAIAGMINGFRGSRLVLLLCAGSVVLAVGSHTPLLRWLYDAGLASTTRYPEKFILTAVFVLTVFAAQILDALLKGDPSVRAIGCWIAGALTVVPAVLFMWSLTPSYAQAFVLFFRIQGAMATVSIQMSRVDWLVAVGRGAVIWVLLRTTPSTRTLWMTLATALAVVDIARLSPEIAPRMPASFFTAPPITASFPRDGAQFRIFHEAAWMGSHAPLRPWGAFGREYWVIRNGLFPMTPAAWGLQTVLEEDIDRTALLPTVDFLTTVALARPAGGPRVIEMAMAMSNARYRAVYRPFRQETITDDAALRPIAFVDTVRQPRYYFGKPVITVRDPRDFGSKLMSGGYPASVAFVVQPQKISGSGVVHSVVESAHRAVLDVESFGQGFLVMSVTPHKYWRIAVDGRSVPAVVTNIGYQGIAVAPGKHRVVMEYRNEIAEAGMWISALVAIVLLATILIRRPHAEPTAP